MDENNDINATNSFVALSLFNILRMPMTMVPLLISMYCIHRMHCNQTSNIESNYLFVGMLMQTWVSVVRINKFLNSEDLDPDAVTHLKDGKQKNSIFFVTFLTLKSSSKFRFVSFRKCIED